MKKYFKSYDQFLFEKVNEGNDLFKIYMVTKDLDEEFSYKGFATKEYFIGLNSENCDNIHINPNFPVLTYNTKLTEQLIKEGKIKKENVYNLPESISLSSSKKKFHEFIGEDEHLPPTVYTQQAAYNLNFPVIAKPASGHSGIGIAIFNSPEELKGVDASKYDLYSEFIDKAEEHRFIAFKGKPIFWMERQPINDKAKTGKGEASEAMEFRYAKKNVNSIPEDYAEVLNKYCDKMSDLPYLCFDIMKSNDGKIYIIESNSQPGMPFDITVEVYKNIFEDFYGRKIDSETENCLKQCGEKLISKTIQMDSDKFIDESSK